MVKITSPPISCSVSKIRNKKPTAHTFPCIRLIYLFSLNNYIYLLTIIKTRLFNYSCNEVNNLRKSTCDTLFVFRFCGPT